MKHFRFLLKHWVLFIVLIFTAFLAPLLEGLTLSFVFPILEGVQGVTVSNIPFPFNRISAFFMNMSLPQRLQTLAAFIIIITSLKSLLLFVNIIFGLKLQMIALKHFRMMFFKQLMRIGMGYFNAQKYSDLQTIGTAHLSNLSALVNKISLSFVHLSKIIVLLGMLVMLSWKMTLISLFLAGLASIIIWRLVLAAEHAGKAYTNAFKRINNILLDTIRGIKVLHLFNREKAAIERHEKEVDHFNNAVYKIGMIRGAVKPVFEAIGMISVALIVLVIALVFPQIGASGLGILMVFIMVFMRISPALLTLNQYRVDIMGDMYSYREFFHFLDPSDKQLLKNGKNYFAGLQKGIELRSVSFGYDPKDAVVLHDISFNIAKGTKVGIVGPSGAGKSTFTELLLRFYDPQTGQIMVDGVDLRDFDLNSWRRHIGVVSQDVFLFNDTIRANIAYASPSATQEDIEQAALKAHAHEFIKGFPRGYDTLLGERGVLLSGGQRQRIAIARAIIINPEILVFDEATSSLDTESERIVQAALDEVGKGRTVITIAHRLSTVFDSDNILVIENGRIVEQGTHQELFYREGLYTKLVKMQNFENPIQKQESLS
ncbi:MAG: ABC transporter ATP-binding protein [Candidatus Margulisiibacteriota bacterium]